MDHEAPSSSTAAVPIYDMSVPCPSVRIHCCTEDNSEILPESLMCFGACSVTLDDINDAANLDEIGPPVVCSKYAGTEVKLDGRDHIILKEDDIIGIFETDDLKDMKPLIDCVLIKV